MRACVAATAVLSDIDVCDTDTERLFRERLSLCTRPSIITLNVILIVTGPLSPELALTVTVFSDPCGAEITTGDLPASRMVARPVSADQSIFDAVFSLVQRVRRTIRSR